MLRAIDRGWFGLVPLEAHLVICGFPRSGTTLLQLMGETAYPQAHSFGVERPGMGAAQNDLPGRWPLIISKRPDDIFWIDEIRQVYHARGTRTRVRFFVAVRDPRAILTSVHKRNPGTYWVSVERWQAIYDHFQYVRRFDDVSVIEYRDLVLDPTRIEAQFEQALGIAPRRSVTEFHASVPGRFDTLALNGVRPLDPSSLDKWRAPRHRERIRELLTEMPELPERLIELGYEPDTEWVREYA